MSERNDNVLKRTVQVTLGLDDDYHGTLTVLHYPDGTIIVNKPGVPGLWDESGLWLFADEVLPVIRAMLPRGWIVTAEQDGDEQLSG